VRFLARMLALAAGLAVTLGLATSPARAALPRPAHVVVVIEENHTFAQIVGNGKAPYLNRLAASGALFTHAYGVTHPSLPNYFALFSGRTNTNGDACPAVGIPKDAPNIASELLASRLTFGAYSESLPETGWTGCAAGAYGRKHAPWVHFSNVPQSLHKPLADLHAFDALGTVTFIVPNVDDDMHDGSIAEADDWFDRRLDALVRWGRTHDTLVVVTWDEGYDDANDIPTFFVGPMVRPGRYAERVDHYRVLRTLEDMYGLAPTGAAAKTTPIADVWR
jgi:acid phosphatase